MRVIKYFKSMLLSVLVVGCDEPDSNKKPSLIVEPARPMVRQISPNSFSMRASKGEHDQPRVQRLFRWDGHVVAQTKEYFFEIDPEGKNAHLIDFVGGRRLLSLTTAFGRPYALGDAGTCFASDGIGQNLRSS
jgi:hypothetical protein